MESLNDAPALSGRSGVVKDVLRCLRDREPGALIVAGPGAGKTAVLKAVQVELQRQCPVIRLTATPALAAVPFGALAPYLAQLPSHDLDSYSAVAAAVAAKLRAEPDLPLFVIDDAHSLDRATVQLVAQATATGSARLLATCRPGALIPPELLALWDDGIIAKFELPPLSREEVHQVCEQVLRADVSAWVSELFAELTEGNPLMLMSLIDSARSAGSIGQRRGTWVLLSSPDLGAVPAADLVDCQFRAMSSEEKTAAAVVALAGPLPLGEFLRFTGPRVVDALETAGIISVPRDHDRIVRPASPIIGEIIRRRVPAGRSASLRASLSAFPWKGAVHPDAFLNQLRWSLAAGLPVASPELLRGAAAANIALDAATALQAAGAIGEDRFLSDARIQLAYANYILGRSEASARYLRAAQPLRYGRPSYLAALLAARLGPLAPRLEFPRVPDSGGAPPSDPDDQRWASPTVDLAVTLLLEGWDGRGPELERRLRSLIGATEGNPEVRIPAASRLAELWTAQGRISAGLEIGREAWRSVREAGLALPLVYEDVLARHCLNLARAGEWEEMTAALNDYREGPSSRLLYSGGLLHLLRGYSRLRQGRIPESLCELLLAVEELRNVDPWKLLAFAHAVTAYAAAVLGRPADAAEQVLAFHSTEFREPAMLGLLANAYCAAAEEIGDADGAAARNELDRVASEARRRGLRAVETDIRRLSLRDGDTAAAAALAASSSAVEGPEARLLQTYALAVASSDSAALVALSDQALEGGYALLALEAARQAAHLLRDDGERAKLHAVQRKQHRLVVAAGMSGHMNIIPGENRADLTAREAEILRLVAAGATNAEIATQLTLSRRTVEGHLHHVFGKLGVTRRSGLATVLHDLPQS